MRFNFKFNKKIQPVVVPAQMRQWRFRKWVLGALTIPMVWGFVLSSSGRMVEEPWKEKPYTQWTAEEVVEVLRKSPWGFIFTVAGRTPGGSPDAAEREALRKSEQQRLAKEPSNLPGEGHVSFSDSEGAVQRTRIAVAWLSSRTFREAIVRAYELDSKSEAIEAKQLLESHPEEYRIGVDYPLAAAASGEDWAKQVGASAYLETRKGKRRIKPLKTETAQPSLAPFAKIIVFFPKTIAGQPAFASPEEVVYFHFDVPSGRKSKHVKVTFELRKMMRDGVPDL